MKNLLSKLGIILFAFAFSMCNTKTNNKNLLKLSSEGKVKDDVSTNEMQNNSDACMMPISASDSIKFISNQIEVKGDVESNLTLTVDSLKKMKVVKIENFTVVCQSGANMKENKSCKGVLLRDILDKAKINQQNHKDRNFYIVARASDNYKATFSWAEIYNNPTGENVYVLFEENGKPIISQGKMILICKNDIKTGPRHVYWLKSIEVNRVE